MRCGSFHVFSVMGRVSLELGRRDDSAVFYIHDSVDGEKLVDDVSVCVPREHRAALAAAVDAFNAAFDAALPKQEGAIDGA